MKILLLTASDIAVYIDISRYQITAYPVDEQGRAGTKQRFDSYPET